MDQAIESGDFERARSLSEEVESLDLYERELRLAKTVHTYWTQKNILSDTMHHDTQICEQQKKRQQDSTNSLFTQKLNSLKKSQEIELKNFNEKWKLTLESAVTSVKENHTESMNAAKRLARSLQFDDAIKVRDAIEDKFNDRRQEISEEINHCFEIQRNELLQTHKREIALLEETWEAELAKIDASFELSRQKLRGKFNRQNAAQITAITRSFTSGSLPMALRMQIVRANPRPPSSTRSLNQINPKGKRVKSGMEKE
jgi:hypothetical protein